MAVKVRTLRVPGRGCPCTVVEKRFALPAAYTCTTFSDSLAI